MVQRLDDSGGGVGAGGITAAGFIRARHTPAMQVVTVGRRFMVLVPPFRFPQDQTSMG
jgi:hypothetical protein